MSSASVRSITCLTPSNGGTSSSCIRTACKPHPAALRRTPFERTKGEGDMRRLIPAALAATVAALLVAVGASSAGRPGNHYKVMGLASDVPGLAPVTDANLQ